tara:strand:+ start:681 stop:968 length:288 start_codon:yes stop_codon:yes gene_type:complete
MIGQEGIPVLGNVSVMTTNNRGHSAEEMTELLLRRIISVADTAPPAIRAQAVEFQDSLRKLIHHYMAEAMRSERVTVAAKLRAEAPHLSEIIERI